ncbi:hypothetical protein ACFX13_029162 [Malus domestica]
MEKVRQWSSCILGASAVAVLAFLLFLPNNGDFEKTISVRRSLRSRHGSIGGDVFGIQMLQRTHNLVELNNGLVRLTFSFPEGDVVGIQYKGIDNLLEVLHVRIFERLEGWPQLHIDQIRIVFKLRQDKFKFMVVSDDIQRFMPTAKDYGKGQQLAYKETVLLTNPSNLEFRGEVDDKYQYSRENKDIKARISQMSLSLWNNAKEQMLKEVNSWPYNFIESKDFPSFDRRGSVAGQLLIHDSYINEGVFGASSAYVGLAAPGDMGSWQRECKGYRFWTRADNQGNFLIKNSHLQTSEKWPNEIGIPDRSTAELYIPDPYPSLANHLFNNNHTNKFRQYGLWDRYADLYPNH